MLGKRYKQVLMASMLAAGTPFGPGDDEQKQSTELQLAAKLIDSVGTMTESIPVLAERVKGLETTMKGFADFDAKNVIEHMERIDAGLATIRKQIANNTKSSVYIAGLEDESEHKKFSIIRAVIGIKGGGSKESFDRCGAGYEYEVFKAFQDKKEKSGHLMGVDTAGGFFVPDQVIPDVIQAIYTRSVLIDLAGTGTTRVSVLDGLTGAPVKIPKFESGVIAYWVGEEDEFAASRAKVGNVTMMPRKLGILTKITDEMRRFQSFGFEQLLRNDMERAAAKKIDWTVLYGPGTDNAPRGITKMAGVQIYDAAGQVVYNGLAAARAGVADWAETELDFDGLDEMRGGLEDNDIDVEEDAGGSWSTISAPRYWRRLRRTKVSQFSGQTTEKSYLLGAPIIRDETLRGLIGDFDRTTQVKNAINAGASIGGSTTDSNGKSGDVIGANWGEVLFGRWSGIEIEDDAGKGKDFASDVTNVKFRLYADVGHRQEKAVVICPNAKMRD